MVPRRYERGTRGTEEGKREKKRSKRTNNKKEKTTKNKKMNYDANARHAQKNDEEQMWGQQNNDTNFCCVKIIQINEIRTPFASEQRLPFLKAEATRKCRRPTEKKAFRR